MAIVMVLKVIILFLFSTWFVRAQITGTPQELNNNGNTTSATPSESEPTEALATIPSNTGRHGYLLSLV